jgi:hypothetical protein
MIGFNSAGPKVPTSTGVEQEGPTNSADEKEKAKVPKSAGVEQEGSDFTDSPNESGEFIVSQYPTSWA